MLPPSYHLVDEGPYVVHLTLEGVEAVRRFLKVFIDYFQTEPYTPRIHDLEDPPRYQVVKRFRGPEIKEDYRNSKADDKLERYRKGELDNWGSCGRPS